MKDTLETNLPEEAGKLEETKNRLRRGNRCYRKR